MPVEIFGQAAQALASLSSVQRNFLRSLPKAELHAHLNGCIPLSCLQELAANFDTGSSVPSETDSATVREGVEKLRNGVELKAIGDFFGLFSAIYALTATPDALARATIAVLRDFLDGPERQCSYLELRTTPKKTPYMTRLEYLQVVLDEIEKYSSDEAALIVSMDRRMSSEDLQECLDLAVELKSKGRRVVGVDLCGDPLAGNMSDFASYFHKAKAAGLSVTLHIAETESNTSEDTLQLLSFSPDRLGHATFLDEDAKKVVFENRMCIEICLTSNLLCKTVKTLQDHHIMYHFKLDHPVAICTDDTLPFRNSLLGEYALLLAEAPLGLGLSEDDITKIASMSMKHRFSSNISST